MKKTVWFYDIEKKRKELMKIYGEPYTCTDYLKINLKLSFQ